MGDICYFALNICKVTGVLNLLGSEKQLLLQGKIKTFHILL